MVLKGLCKTLLLVAAAVFTSTASGADPLCSIVPASYAQAKIDYPQSAAAITELSSQNIVTWYSDRDSSATATIQSLLSSCSSSSRVIVAVYGLPNKDCVAGYSTSGGNANANDYANFLNRLTGLMGDRKVLYVLEPDALGLLANGGCAATSGYKANMITAVQKLSVNANADIYLDVGYWTLAYQSSLTIVITIIKELVAAGRIKGIALNTSNYRSTAEMAQLCQAFQNAMGSTAYRCIVDTSRNFNNPISTEWCNVGTAGVGTLPTTSTGYSNVEAFIWAKPVGESDGTCNDGSHTAESLVGPTAGLFFQDAFKRLWNQGYFVQSAGRARIVDTVTLASGSACSIQTSMDYSGSDLGSAASSTPEGCCAICSSYSGCGAYSWNTHNGGTCWLKSGNGNLYAKSGVYSAVLSSKASFSATEEDVDYPGNDVGSVASGSASGCASLCIANSKCGAFTWTNFNGGTCWLKSGKSAAKTLSGGISASLTAGSSCSFSNNVDFYGSDMKSVQSSMSDYCCVLCRALSGCKAFTWTSFNGGTCWLKSATGATSSIAGAVSGRL